MLRIKINASDLAKYTGQNRFCTPEERRSRLWTRNPRAAARLGIAYARESASATEAVVGRMTVPERAAVCETNGLPPNAPPAALVSALHERVVDAAVRQDTAATSKRAVVATAAAALTAAPAALALKMRAALENDACIKRGAKREAAALDALEAATGEKVVARNSEYFHRSLGMWREHELVLVGMIDGRRSSDGEVVETKERRNRLFRAVPEYERVQLHAYMFLTQTSHATLLERYDDEIAEHAVPFDAEFWEDSVRELRAFLDGECEAAARVEALQ